MSVYVYPPQQVSISGVATEATQLQVLTQVTAINANTADAATATKQDAQTALLTTIDADTSTLAATDFATETTLASLSAKVTIANTDAVTVVASTLPDGAATEATLAQLIVGSGLDQIDSPTGPLLNCSSTNIPASSDDPLELVASLASNIYKVISVEDIGEFMGLYYGGIGEESLLCVLPLGGGEVQIIISAGQRVSIRNMKNAVIASGFLAINFLGS